ncbi:MAG: hypothetical protein ACYT04_81225, partial [Nostoc sp.]
QHLPNFVYLEAPIGEDPDKRDYIVSNARILNTGFEADWSLSRGICLRVHTVQAPFLDIGTPDSFVQAEGFILQNYAKLIG